MFNRIIIQELKQWRAKKDRKPLIMLGARQVGKTSVLQKFGEEYFEHCAYFSLNEEEGVCDIFRKTKNWRNLPTANTRTKTLIGIPREVDVFIRTLNISLLTQNIGEHPERSLIIDSTLHITNGRFK
jgi:hypothetical protein